MKTRTQNNIDTHPVRQLLPQESTGSESGTPRLTIEREVLANVLSVLANLNLVPVLIGGRALIAHGMPCETEDIDLLVDSDTTGLQLVLDRLRSTGFQVDGLSEIAVEQRCSVELRCYQQGVQVDILHSSDNRLREVHQHATLQTYLGIELLVARLNDVIQERRRRIERE